MLVPAVAAAGTFSIVPVRIYMTPRDRAVAITIQNEGDTEVALQADTTTWRQKPDGSDEQVPTDDLILSPPILKLPPRGRQVVRLARIAPPDLSQQLTYRLIVREVPEATSAKDQVIQIPIALALSMPVFITPPGAKREVACQPARSPDGKLQVSCANTGTAYAQVREVRVQQGGTPVGHLETGIYILPGARKAIPVPTDKPVTSGPLELNVVFDDGKSQSFQAVLP